MGVRSKRLLACHSIEQLRAASKRSLPRMVFDYIDGAAQTESTAAENRAGLDRLRWVAGGPSDVSQRSLAVDLFRTSASMPIIIGPTGLAGAFWPQGDLELARAAGRFGIPFVVSNGAGSPLEQIVKASEGRTWLQLYISRSQDQTLKLVRLAESLGIEAIEITVDSAIPGRRIRDLDNGFMVPFKWTAGKLLDAAAHPGWASRSLKHGMPKPCLIDLPKGGNEQWATISDFMHSQINPGLTWDDLRWLRDQYRGRLIVKGLLNPADVERSISAGYDGVVISNHGGRQLDAAVSTIEMLPEFVAAAKGRIPILIDSGFRSGTDVLKAVALGAAAVQIGRSTLYGLSIAGQAGVERALSILRTELDIAMALTGLANLADARPEMLRAR